MRPTDHDYGEDHSSLHPGLKHHEPLYTDELHNEDVAHEHSDVPVRPLLMFTFGLAVVTGVVMLLMYGLFGVLESQAAKNDPVLSPHAQPADQLPPMPRIRDNMQEPALLRKQRQMEAEQLGQYGWVDQGGGVARVPIAEAKKKLLHDGLPVRADAPTDPYLGTRWAGPARGESSSGRMVGKPVPDAAAPAATVPAKPADPHKGGH
jgi:hypothetical protein